MHRPMHWQSWQKTKMDVACACTRSRQRILSYVRALIRRSANPVQSRPHYEHIKRTGTLRDSHMQKSCDQARIRDTWYCRESCNKGGNYRGVDSRRLWAPGEPRPLLLVVEGGCGGGLLLFLQETQPESIAAAAIAHCCGAGNRAACGCAQPKVR